MIRFPIFALSALLLTVGLSSAQTGPAKLSDAAKPAPTQPSQANGRLTPDNLVQYLKGQGHAVEKKTAPNASVTLIASIKKDGWSFQVECEFTPDQKTLNLLCPLGAAPSSQSQLLEILKGSYLMNPAHFSYRDTDHKLILEDPLYGTQMTEAQFQGLLNSFLNKVRGSFPLWSGSQGAAATLVPSGSTNTVPTNMGPANTVPTSTNLTNPTPANSQNLVGTVWVGNENLQNFNRLEFRFLANGSVMMVDAEGQIMGIYTQQGQSVTLTFADGVGYQGTINGSVLSGTGHNRLGNWNFTVSK